MCERCDELDKDTVHLVAVQELINILTQMSSDQYVVVKTAGRLFVTINSMAVPLLFDKYKDVMIFLTGIVLGCKLVKQGSEGLLSGFDGNNH